MLGALVASIAAACTSVSTVIALPIDGRVLAFMECEECIQRERDKVVQMGDTAVPALRQALLHGPSDSRLSLMDSSLRRFTTLAPSQSAVQYQLRIYRSMYTTRSALALGLIGGAAARAALCEAKKSALLSRLESAVVDSSLVKVGGACT